MALSKLDTDEYNLWLSSLKDRVRLSQQRAISLVNVELLALYWSIGSELDAKINDAKWGDGVVDTLAKDLLDEFPAIKGFSRTNIFNMLKWYRFYANSLPLVQQAVGLSKIKDDANMGEIVQQLDGQFPALLSQVPWGHHIVVVTKCVTVKEAVFYLQQNSINGWSRNVLSHQITSGLYNRKGKTINNFQLTLPKQQSDQAEETLKNPYLFDFLNLSEELKEIELEKALVAHIKKFLLELGKGFAYAGNQNNLKVEGDDYYLDLLFYNFHLHCFVIFELKVGDFKPEYAGKLNFYVNAVNAELKGVGDNPTIGVLLCKTPNKSVIKYSLQSTDNPIGVAEYELTNLLPKQLKGQIPSIEEFEEELNKEIVIQTKPIDRKKQMLQKMLRELNGDEVKRKKTKEDIMYIFNTVLIKIQNRVKILLKKEMEEFQEVWIGRTINGSSNRFVTSVDIEALNLQGRDVSSCGLYLELKAFKKMGVKAFNIWETLEFMLYEYKYEVGQPRKPWTSKLYHNRWSKKEIDSVAEQWATIIIDSITSQISLITTK